jgi:biotin transport system substrate-specific component
MIHTSILAKTPLSFTAHKHVARVLRVALGAIALMAASHLKVPFLYTPVPFTLQPQMVLLLAATLGAQEGVFAVALWLGAGVLGAPSFAAAASGSMALMGPTAGYLISHLPTAAAVGTWGRGRNIHALGVWFIATGATLVMGTLWLAQWVPQNTAWQLGFWPFVATDCVKMVLVFIAYRSLR